MPNKAALNFLGIFFNDTTTIAFALETVTDGNDPCRDASRRNPGPCSANRKEVTAKMNIHSCLSSLAFQKKRKKNKNKKRTLLLSPLQVTASVAFTHGHGLK
jgi:hypothetical protein